MANTQLIEPFYLEFEKDGIVYSARVTYAKSGSSCLNIFEVDIVRPTRIKSFCLQEKPVKSPDLEYMVWMDQEGKQKEFYQVIGIEITQYLKSKLGIFLLDAPLHGNERNPEREDGY